MQWLVEDTGYGLVDLVGHRIECISTMSGALAHVPGYKE